MDTILQRTERRLHQLVDQKVEKTASHVGNQDIISGMVKKAPRYK